MLKKQSLLDFYMKDHSDIGKDFLVDREDLYPERDDIFVIKKVSLLQRMKSILKTFRD